MRYFFDLFEAGQPDLHDAQGSECGNLEAVRAEAVKRYSSRLIECANQGRTTPAIRVAVRSEMGDQIGLAITQVSWLEATD